MLRFLWPNFTGFAALRVGGEDSDPPAVKGAWFVREFVLACEMFAHQDHLIDLVAKVRICAHI